MEDPALLATASAGAVGALYVGSNLFNAWTIRQQLNKIPTVGASGIFSSYFGAYRYLRNARDMIQEGYNKYPGTAFKFPMVSKWMIVVSGPQMVEDLRKAPDDQMSMMDAVADLIQIDYTVGPEIHRDPYHVATVRTPLTRNLAARFDDVQDEIAEAFTDHIPPTEEWTSVQALPAVVHIVCRTSNRLFVGLPLCRDPDYRALNEEFTIDVIKGGHIINLFPNFLKPLAGRLFTNVEVKVKRGIKHVGPIIQERLDKEEQYGRDWPGKPNDFISWLLETAQGYQRSIRDMTLRLLSVNFAAIHTSSMTFTQTLFNLAAYPSHIPALREEIEAVIREEGLTKLSLHKMRKLDSFIKESGRCGSTGALIMERKALKDFTFSNGTVIPKGQMVAIASFATHRDEVNYSDPDKFDGFRFADMRESETEGFSKHQMVSLSNNYMVFGVGRHACPGRFFAVNEIKAMLVHVLLNYDVGLENPGVRPPDRWFGTHSAPDPTAKVLFRKRRV
ncbi:hypothetical protein Hypma_012416 [Hypsizygus marmoreus]|uniref:Ent-kaurene oxidase n=1 Tax=Hypsizygus marmoreus TaxID=39966 RepID=A0A369JEV9_HYPMA|nr:hypothetical protein Hypma_012416 [Hypsizygus marmoreus]